MDLIGHAPHVWSTWARLRPQMGLWLSAGVVTRCLLAACQRSLALHPALVVGEDEADEISVWICSKPRYHL